MKPESLEFIEQNITTLRQIVTNQSYGRTNIALRTQLERIGNDECWSYCRDCHSGFIRLVKLCIDAYDRENRKEKTESIRAATGKNKRRQKASIH